MKSVRGRERMWKREGEKSERGEGKRLGKNETRRGAQGNELAV